MEGAAITVSLTLAGLTGRMLTEAGSSIAILRRGYGILVSKRFAFWTPPVTFLRRLSRLTTALYLPLRRVTPTCKSVAGSIESQFMNEAR